MKAAVLGFLACLVPGAMVSVSADDAHRVALAPPTETIQVDLKLATGGALTGWVVDHTVHGLVIVRGNVPYVFAWSELESGSAYVVRRDLAVLARGGSEHLGADDHFELAVFALGQNRTDLAAREFRAAGRIDDRYEPKARRAMRAYRRKQKNEADRYGSVEIENASDPASTGRDSADAEVAAEDESSNLVRFGATLVPGVSENTAEAVLRTYRSFGEKVREVISRRMDLVETEHFLIWTDWTKQTRSHLGAWCEAMYDALCVQFNLDPTEPVFLAKCPVFCFRAKPRFLKFSRLFDGYDGRNATGYTRSIEQSGHVHMALLLRGSTQDDFDRFATTLVHEGTHAFVHRLYSTRLIPPWVNEGLADWMAERVLGERCPTGENAALLARQYVLYDWPIGDLLRRTEPIAVHEYPLAHSLVAYLEHRAPGSIAEFVRFLKEGSATSAALDEAYGGLTLDQLERDWRTSVRNAVTADVNPSGHR